MFEVQQKSENGGNKIFRLVDFQLLQYVVVLVSKMNF